MIYEFEGFRFDAEYLMLYRGEEEILLAPKAAQTLLTLIGKRGKIVSKDELMNAIWGDSIVEEANLTQYVHVLRKILGEAANGKPLIETLRRRGYRFNGEVRCFMIEPDALKSEDFSLNGSNGSVEKAKFPPSDRIANEISGASNSTNASTKSSIKPKLLKTLAAALVGLLIIAVSAFLYSRKTGSSAQKDVSGISLKRLTPDRNAIQPTVSPDGQQMIYSTTDKDSKQTLWLTDLTSGSAVKIMSGGVYMDFAFSADGKRIYYLTSDFGGPNNKLVSIPLFGGKPQVVLENVLSPPAVSSSGKIAVISGSKGFTVLNENGVTETSIETLMPNFNAIIWNSQMSWSPDGTRIALCGKDYEGKAKILDFSIKNRTGQFLPAQDFSEIDDAVWLADGSGLLITAKEKTGEPYQIWRVAYPSGEARRITRDFNDYDWISLSNDSKTLVVGQNITKTNIWVASLDNLENPEQLTFGSEAQDGYRGLAFAPDGKIIFTSPRSGSLDLWQMNRDGGSQQPLTAEQGSFNVAPRVTADGRYIVFVSSRNGGKPHIWRMNADGQNPLQLTDGSPSGESFFDISADGSRIFYAVQSEQKIMTTRQVSINGGEPLPVADDYQSSGSIAAAPNGELVMRYVYLPGQEKPWQFGVFPVGGGEPLTLMQVPASRNFIRWAADSSSFFYLKWGTAQIWRQSLDSGAPVIFMDLKRGQLFNFAFSPDFKQIVFAHGSQFNEAVLIDNFGQ